ncbi:HutD family protein [Paraglaciecola sp.]|uniref:HutD/Ves family protein n=1 Tax=Paraglaciecola sp. TaxID=1920173 RepID=UPI0030F47E1F
MFTIIPPEHFKKILWKNGKGYTTELAISEGGDLVNFDWRLSIASVVSDGDFSDFSGYDRHLVLLSGAGIKLTYDGLISEQLITPLSIATFDGGAKTTGSLRNGSITDFNIMVKQGYYRAEVKSYVEQQTVMVPAQQCGFVYSQNDSLQLTNPVTHKKMVLDAGHLLQRDDNNVDEVNVSGANFIVICLTRVVR